MSSGASPPITGAAADVYRRVFELAPVASALVRPDGRILHANLALVSLAGYPEQELLALPLDELVPPGEDEQVRDDLETVRCERRLIRPGAEPLWVAVYISTIADGRDAPLQIVQIENIADRKRTERKLRRLADHDALTWLLNRRAFIEGLHVELTRMRSVGEAGALFVLDLDNFKQVNDTAGHPAGDSVLQTTADVLRRRLRSTDVIGRLGGDEFAALVLAVSPEQAQDIADDLTAMLWELAVEASIGVALIEPGADESEAELLAKADRAMYATKSARRR